MTFILGAEAGQQLAPLLCLRLFQWRLSYKCGRDILDCQGVFKDWLEHLFVYLSVLGITEELPSTIVLAGDWLEDFIAVPLMS